MKNIKIYLTLIVIILIAVLLILNKFLAYGIILLGAGVLGFWFWHLFIKSKEDEISKLENKLENFNDKFKELEEENKELRSRKLNISEIDNILDLGLIEVDTNFTRTFNKEFTKEDKEIKFLGAMRVDLKAKYGVSLKEIRFKYDEKQNEIRIANAKPKFLSFGSRKITWPIEEILEVKKPWFGTNHWGTHPELDKIAGQIKEEYRVKVEEESDNGPEELEWILKPLEKQIEKAIHLMLRNFNGKIEMVDDYNDTYKSLDDFDLNQITGGNLKELE